jgi:hypothetical protein
MLRGHWERKTRAYWEDQQVGQSTEVVVMLVIAAVAMMVVEVVGKVAHLLDPRRNPAVQDRYRM